MTVLSDPPGATVQVRRLDDAGRAGAAVADGYGRTPLTVTLPTTDGQRYVAVASAPQHLPASVEIERDPVAKTQYEVLLPRHLDDTVEFVPMPRKTDEGWVLDFERQSTPAYVLEADEGGAAMRGSVEGRSALTRVTANDDEDVDLRSPAASPTDDLLLVQRVARVDGEPRTVRLSRDGKEGPTLQQAAESAGVTPRQILDANPRAEDVGDLYDGPVRVPTSRFESFVYRQPDGTGPSSRLTVERQAAEFTPAFADEGAEALYASTTVTPSATLWRTGVAGGSTARTQVTRDDALDWNPSVGGGIAAFSRLLPRAGESLPQLWRIYAGEVALLAGGVESPAVSPDGSRIAFVEPIAMPGVGESRSAVRRLGVMNSDGSGRTQLTVNVDYDVRDPAWSPDGRLLVFAANGPGEPQPAPGGSFGAYPPFAPADAPLADAPPNFDLYALPINASGQPGAPVRLTSNLSHDDSPAFGRDGTTLYFRSNRGGTWNLWRIAVPAELLSQP